MRAESQQSGDWHRNGSVQVQTLSPFIPEVFTCPMPVTSRALSFHAGKFPSTFEVTHLSRAYKFTYMLKFKYNSQKADPTGELSSQLLRSTTKSTFLKHKIPLSFLLQNIYFCFSWALFFSNIFQILVPTSFYNYFGSEYNILNSSSPHKTNKLKEKQKILYLLSFFFFFLKSK